MEQKQKKKPAINFSDYGKVPPQAVEIEEAVIGALLSTNSKETSKALSFLKENDFYKEHHQIIYGVIKEMVKEGIPVEILTIVEELRKRDKLDEIGGAYKLVQLSNACSSDSNLDYYSKVLRQKTLQRTIIQLGFEMSKDGFDASKDPFDVISASQQVLSQLLDMSIKEGTIINSNDVGRLFFEQSDKSKQDNKVYKTGHKRFDEKIGFVKNKIILVGGAAKDGKSKFISHLLFRLFDNYPGKVACNWATLEDDANDVLCGYLSSKIFLSAKQIKRRHFNEETYKVIEEHVKTFNSFDIEFIEQSMKSTEINTYFDNFCRTRKDKLNVLVVDNILSLGDREEFKRDLNSMYDFIMGEMLKTKQRTKGLIIIIHHFNDAQQDPSRLESAYRPRIGDLKGTESFRRVPNSALLLNNPGKRKDLVSKYPGKEKELKSIFICDTGANRDDKSDDDTALIRFVHDLDFNLFEEL